MIGHCAACGSVAPRSHLLCRFCWSHLPGRERGAVYAAWRHYQRDEISLAELRAAQRQAVDTVRSLLVDELLGRP